MKFTTFPDNINPFAKKGVVKLGIDPTGPELHLGHLLPLKLFKEFISQGFQPIIILGSFTAQIGDATGRDVTRPILSSEDTMKNAKLIVNQVKRILGDVEIRFNSDWLNMVTLPELMNIISKFSVQKLLDRDNFSKRFETHVPIAMHELMGPILQGIDSLTIEAVVEVGGTDQLFNFKISRDIQEMFGQEPEVCVFSPIINGTDGKKMSKSFNNCIFLNDTPENIFGKSMRISDETMNEWLEIFDAEKKEHPMEQKKCLAFQITKEIWNEEKAISAKLNFEKTIQNKDLPDNIPELKLDKMILIVKNILNGSNSDARRMLIQKAVSVNGIKVDENHILNSGDIVKVGKLKFAKII
jgi:tyrosyl-tRNA synthetase